MGLAAALGFGVPVAPVMAQAVDGTLIDLGEGENPLLTTDRQTLAPGQQITYQVAYDGDEQPISIWMNVVPADGAEFPEIGTTTGWKSCSENFRHGAVGARHSHDRRVASTNWQVVNRGRSLSNT